MKLAIGITFALLAHTALATELPAGCSDYLDLRDLKSGPAAITEVEVTENICISAKQFSLLTVSDPEPWDIHVIRDHFFMKPDPRKSIRTLAVLFEPGQSTGHAVVLTSTSKDHN